MILTTEQQQLEFLTECYKHIHRIYNTYLTDSEKQDADPNSEYNRPRLSESGIAHVRGFPTEIKFYGWLHNEKMGKLYLLVSIYNKAIKKIEKNKSIDLSTLFAQAKAGQDYKLFHRINYTSNTLMQTHRSDFLRTSFFSLLLNFFFPPKSQVFLEKYGFFESKSTTPLHNAVFWSDINKVKSLVSIDTVNLKDKYGRGDAPLSIAAGNGDINIAKVLIENGAAVDSDALESAIRAGHIDMVRFLIRNGANINELSSSGVAPFRFAINCITSSGYDWNRGVNIVNELLKETIDLDSQTEDGESLLEHLEKAKKYFASSWSDNLPVIEEISESITNIKQSYSQKM